MLQQQDFHESYTYKTTPSRDLLVDVFPALTPSKGCIIFLHGGALLLGSRNDLPHSIVNFLTKEGWDVATLDYRLISECPISEIVQDANDGCKFVKGNYETKPVIVCGYSAGAFLALQQGTLDTPVDGILAFAGYGDLGAEWYFTPSKFFIEYKNVDHVAAKIAASEPFSTIEERIDLYVYLRQKGTWPHYILGEQNLNNEIQRWSPIRHIPPTYPRTVLIHGDKDCDVPVETSKEMSKALSDHKIPHELIVLEELDHDLFQQLELPQVEAAWRRALSYLEPQN